MMHTHLLRGDSHCMRVPPSSEVEYGRILRPVIVLKQLSNVSYPCKGPCVYHSLYAHNAPLLQANVFSRALQEDRPVARAFITPCSNKVEYRYTQRNAFLWILQVPLQLLKIKDLTGSWQMQVRILKRKSPHICHISASATHAD